MKLNKLFLGILGLSAVVLTSCKDDDDKYTAATWNATADYADIYFNKAALDVEVDPADPTTGSFEIFRRNTKGELTVKYDVVTNTDSIFTIAPITFADGDSVTTVNVTYPQAAIGKTYTLKITVSDPSMVSNYSKGVGFTFSVTRVKWNLLGTGDVEDNFYIGEAGKVEIYQKDTDHNSFRLVHLMDDMLAAAKAKTSSWDPGEFDGTQPNNVDITIDQNGIITYEDFSSGCYNLNYSATVMICHPKSFSSLKDPSNWTYNKVLSYQDADTSGEKLPGQIQLAPYYYMEGVGGWNKTQEDGVIVITFPGYTPLYTASIENGDFAMSKLYTGTFVSSQFNQNFNQVSLYKGMPKTAIEEANPGCYDRFKAENGDLYCITNAYAPGSKIYFCVKAGDIFIPEGFESQALGMKQMGYDIYAAINAGKSTFAEDKVELNITFQDKDGENQLATATETLINFTYTKDMVLGAFNYLGVISGKTYNFGQFTITEHATAADSLIVKDFYLENNAIRAAYDLDAASFVLENFTYLGIEEDEGTPYYIFTYALSGKDWIPFDLNMDGSITSTDMILVGTPDLQSLYSWIPTTETAFVPVDEAASARSSSVKSLKHKKGAKLNVKLPEKAKKMIHK